MQDTMPMRRSRSQNRAAKSQPDLETPYAWDVQSAGSMRDVIEEWELHLLGRAMSPKTVEIYMGSAIQFADYLGHTIEATELAGVNRRHIGRWLAHLTELGRKPATLSVRFRSLQQLFQWAERERIVQENPMRDMQAPIVPESPTPILRKDEIVALMKVLRRDRTFEGVRDEAIAGIMLDAGVRRAELLGIRYDPNDPSRNDVVDLRDGVVRVFGKGRRERFVHIGRKTSEALARYRRRRSQHRSAHLAAFWLSAKGAVTGSGLFQIVQRRGLQAGIPGLHPHALRHTWAHYYSLHGGRESDLMQLAGWKSSAMVRRYGQSAAAARALEAARGLSLADRVS